MAYLATVWLVVWIIASLGNLLAPQQYCCRGAYQHSDRSDNSNQKFSGIETSRDLSVFISRYWHGTWVSFPFATIVKNHIIHCNKLSNIILCGDLASRIANLYGPETSLIPQKAGANHFCTRPTLERRATLGHFRSIKPNMINHFAN